MMQPSKNKPPENFTWPVDYNVEKRRRLVLIRKAADDRKFRIQLMRYYKTHPVEWINDFCVTFDPRARENKLMPFVLFPRQVEFIHFLQECLTEKESGLVEKARDIGASWLCCAFSTWLFIFHEGATVGFGSRKAEYVDKPDDPKAIFPKIRQILKNLPAWMMPEGFNWGVHSTHMKLVNPANMSTITGESGDAIGRGGRTTIFFKDESAWYENPEGIEAALGDNTDVQIDISSVHGTANPFYRRRMAGEIWEIGKKIKTGLTRVFIFDWRDHPGKTEEWYKKRRDKAEAEGMLHVFAQEVDRDYSGAVENVIIPAEWARACIDAHIKLGIKPDGEKVAGQDVADGGGDKNAIVARHGVIAQYANAWGGEAGDAAGVAVPVCVELMIEQLFYDSIGVGSGFKTGINNLKTTGSLPAKLKVAPWGAGDGVQDPTKNVIPGDKESPTNEDFFANLKAQGWWRLRTRIYKTYRAVVHGDIYPHDELISFPSNMPGLHQLIMELSQAVRKYDGKGKLLVDKKPKGAISPNLADACVICYNPIRKPSSFFT
jgi:phage terminase large subunit